MTSHRISWGYISFWFLFRLSNNFHMWERTHCTVESHRQVVCNLHGHKEHHRFCKLSARVWRRTMTMIDNSVFIYEFEHMIIIVWIRENLFGFRATRLRPRIISHINVSLSSRTFSALYSLFTSFHLFFIFIFLIELWCRFLHFIFFYSFARRRAAAVYIESK